MHRRNGLCSSRVDIPQNSENKPRGLYFAKALFEGLIFGGAFIRRGLSTEGNLRFKIDWASLIVERKFTVFALFYFVFEGNFQVQAPGGAYIWRGDLTEGFWRYEFGGLVFGAAYFRNFTAFSPKVLIEEANFCLLLETGPQIYVRIQTMRRLIRLQGKGSTFISHSF